MKYNFDKVIDRRNTGSSKWDNNMELFETDDVLDMWVADMDFECPEPVVRALKQRIEHPIYGYTFPPKSLYEAIVERMYRYYGWRIKKEWIMFTAGVVNGLFCSVQAIARPGDEIIIQPPVYYPFARSIKNAGCVPLENCLLFDGERYTFDFDGLQDMFRPITTFPSRAPRIRGLMLCSPHNPVGRVWTRDELATLGSICMKNNCVILSDEIHCDLLSTGVTHTVTSTLSEEIEQNTITFMAGSKTFNLAGLSTSFVVIPNDRLRKSFADARAGHNSGNFLGYIALEAAYRHGDEYLSQLREYLAGNIRCFSDFIKHRIPRLKVVSTEGTYLVWVDMRGLGMTPKQLQHFMRHKARLALDDGYAFGKGGEGFQRFNLGCPRSTVEEACKRLENAINEL